MDLVNEAAWYAERHASGAERFFNAFSTARGVLSTFPFAGRERREMRVGLRSFPVHPFVMFYRINEEKRVVTVVRVIHGHMDIDIDDFEEL